MTEVEESIVSGGVREVVCTSRVPKMKEHLPLCREILYHFMTYGLVYSILVVAYG